MAPTKFRPQGVTGILAVDNQRVPGLRVESEQDVRDFLLPGPRLSDGEVVPSGWADLECDECHDVAIHCPNLRRALPHSFIMERQAADVAVWQHEDGLVTLTGTI